MLLNKDFQPYQHNPSSQTIAAIGNGGGVEKHMLKNMSAQMLRYGSILEKQRKRAQSGARLNLSSSKSPGGGAFKNRYDQHHHYGLNQVDNDTITLDDKLSHIRKERKKKVGGSQDYISLKSKS